LYPCAAVEHSYNCMVLLCSLFLWPSGHYTNYEVLFNKAKNINIEQEDITATCDALMDGMYNFSAGPSSPYLPTINVYIGLVLKISDNTIRIVAYRSDSTEKPYYKIKSGGVWKNIWFQ